MAKVSASVCAAAGTELRTAFDGLDEKDRPRCCRYMRTAMGKLRRGWYSNMTEFKQEATAALKPQAVDWDAIFEFLQKLADLFAKLLPIFIKRGPCR